MAKNRKRRHPFVFFYILFVLAVALTAAWFYLPIDSWVAQKDAERKGYTITSEPAELDYKYYYNRLNEAEQQAYNLVLGQITDFPERVSVPSLSGDEVQEVYTALSYDNPELFFLGNYCKYFRIGALFYFEPQYKMTRDEYLRELEAVELAAGDLLASAPVSGSDYEKELYIHDTLGELGDYETGSDSSVYTPYGMLVNHKANCEGYSRTAQYLLKQLGVVSRVISGIGTSAEGTENHMWNVITVSGQEYNVDITWDDYIIDSESGTTSDEPSHVFFNVSKEDMSVDHEPDSEDLWENCTSSELNYYELNGLYCDSYESAATSITRTLPSQLNSGKHSLELKFSSDSAYEKSKEQLIDNDRIYYLLSSSNVLVRSANKVSTNKLQYNLDPVHKTIRFFFLK